MFPPRKIWVTNILIEAFWAANHENLFFENLMQPNWPWQADSVNASGNITGKSSQNLNTQIVRLFCVVVNVFYYPLRKTSHKN